MPIYDVVVRAEEHIAVWSFSEKDARSFVRASIKDGVIDLVPKVVSVVERPVQDGGSDD
jgi:hypothetical protein